jgi:hypothetical protein
MVVVDKHTDKVFMDCIVFVNSYKFDDDVKCLSDLIDMYN